MIFNQYEQKDKKTPFYLLNTQIEERFLHSIVEGVGGISPMSYL